MDLNSFGSYDINQSLVGIPHMNNSVVKAAQFTIHFEWPFNKHISDSYNITVAYKVAA